MFMEPRTSVRADKAIVMAGELQKAHRTAQDAIRHSQQRIQKQRFKESKTAPQLKKGDKVYLLTKNLKTKRKTKKLDHVKVGPFLIAEQKGAVSYRLELPPDAKIYPVFHVSLLEPAHPDAVLQTTFHYQEQEDDEYEVEKIVDYDRKSQRYLIKWKGYPSDENTWEPLTNLNCPKMLRRYHQRS